MKNKGIDPVSLPKKIEELYAAHKGYPVKPKIPDNIMIEVTNACNLRCRMCYNKQMRRKKGFMSFSLFRKIIDEAAALHISNAGLYTVGESFLHPKIFDFIKYAKGKGIQYVYITTNGQLLDDTKIKKIFDSGLDSIKFSIDAGTKHTYESTREGAQWECLLDSVRKVRALRDSMKSRLRIFASYIVMRDNHAEIENFYETFKGLVDDFRFSFIFNLGGTVDTSGMFISPLKEFRHPCPLLWNRFIVTYDGKLTACCVDFEGGLIYGDLKRDTLRESWNNAVMSEFRRLHKKLDFQKIPVCNRCDEILMSPERDTILSRQTLNALENRSQAASTAAGGSQDRC